MLGQSISVSWCFTAFLISIQERHAKNLHRYGQMSVPLWILNGNQQSTRLHIQLGEEPRVVSVSLLICISNHRAAPSPPPSLCAQNGLLHPEFPRMIVSQDQSGPWWLSDQLRKVLFICVCFLFLFPSHLCQKPKDGIAQISPGLHEPQKFYPSPHPLG